MKRLSRWVALSALGIAVIPFVSGCSSTDRVQETATTTTTSVQPGPAPMTVVTPPPSTVNTTEEKSTSNSTEVGSNSTEQSTSPTCTESKLLSGKGIDSPAPSTMSMAMP